MYNIAIRSGLDHFSALARALGDPARVRILMALGEGEVCSCHLADLVGLDPSTVSRHMGVLKSVGLVSARKDGRWVHYRRPAAEPGSAVDLALSWLERALAGDPTIADDRDRLPGLCCGDSGPDHPKEDDA